MRLVFFSVIIVIVNFDAFSSERIRHFTEKNGLSSRDIHHCLTDSRGFIWVATANGLNRFDGYKFWQPGKDLLKLSSTRITWLLEDTNTLWIGTDNGINLLNLSNYHLTGIFNHTNEDGSLTDNYITGIHKSFDKTIWVTTGEGMLHKYLGKGKFQQIKNPLNTNGSFGVRIFFTEDSSSYWVRSENTGTYRINKKDNVITSFPLTTGNHIGGIRFIPGKGTLDFRKEGVFRYDQIQNKFIPYLTNIGNDVYDILPDMNNNLWIISGDSRKISCLSGTEISDKTNQLFPPPYIVHIRNMLPGPVSSIWICTNNGLYQISNDKELFTSILKQNEIADRDYIPSFRGMIQDKSGKIFIGGYGGFFSIDKDKKINRLPVTLKPYNPFVLIDEDDIFFWAVTEGYGLVKINKKNATASICYRKHITPEDHSYRYLTAGVKDRNGSLILGGYEGLFSYDPKTDRLKVFNISFGNKNLGEMTIKHLTITSNNYLWISTQNGLFVLDQNRKPLWHFHKDSEEKFKLLLNMVLCVIEAKNHSIWIGTKGGGIRVFKYKSQTPIFFNTTNGLSDDNIVSLQEDLHQRIWAASDFGLSVIKPESGKVISYFAEDGLADNEFNAGSSLIQNSGLLLFGGVNGITICNPETNLNPINKSQLIQFSRIELINNDGAVYKEYNPDIIRDGISLSYTNRFFELEFFITEFLLSEKNSYQYKLEGYDNRWIPIGEQNNIRFAALPAGDFKLHIKGTGFRGTSTLNEIVIPITVRAAFYNTIWFYLSCIVIIGLIIYLILFQKIRRLSC